MTAATKMPSDQPRPAPLPRSIVLVGLMGAGKTNIGRKLSDELAVPFVDSDKVIEEVAGMSIASIFELYGEAKFRAIEAREIARLMTGAPQIISTGGGAFMQENTRQIIRDGSLSVWLKATPHTLAGRISNLDSRPLLKGKDPVEVLTRLSAERTPFYQQAELTVDTDGLSLSAAIEKVKTMILAHLNPGSAQDHLS